MKRTNANHLRPGVIAALAFCLLAGVRVHGAIDVSQVEWGFDGSVKLGAFNALRVYVRNPDASTFEGEIRLRREDLTGRNLGAPLVKKLYLVSNSARWVEFHPYLLAGGDSWVLSWGRKREERRELDPPPVGEPAAIYLRTGAVATMPPGPIRRFDAERFPATLAVTDGLKAVVLDRPPDLDSVRKQVFLDWIRRGGEVHIVSGGGIRFDGDYTFCAGEPDTESKFGGGRVVRHAEQAGDLDRPTLVAMGVLPEREIERTEDPRTLWTPELRIFEELFQLARIDHNWKLFLELAVILGLLVGPFNAFFSIYRPTWDYRASLGLVVVVSLLAAGAVFAMGFRGYGRPNRMHAVSLARQIEPGRYDLLQYVTFFATRGDDYAFEHGARGEVASTAQRQEAVRGRIGDDGVLVADVPVNSRRPFVHRSVVELPDIHAVIEQNAGAADIEKLVVRLGTGPDGADDPPQLPAVRRAWAVIGTMALPMQFDESYRLVRYSHAGASTLENQFGLQDLREHGLLWSQPTFLWSSNDEPADATTAAERIAPMLIAGELDVMDDPNVLERRADPRLHLFLLVDAPAEAAGSWTDFAEYEGRTLYHLILDPPSSRAEADG